MPLQRVVKALYNYQAIEGDELSFKEDELLSVLPSDNPEWLLATPLDISSEQSQSGIIPANHIEDLEVLEAVDAAYEYTSQDDSEVSISEGELVFVLIKIDKEWWLIKNSVGQFGLVPASYLIQQNDKNEDLKEALMNVTEQEYKDPLEDYIQTAQEEIEKESLVKFSNEWMAEYQERSGTLGLADDNHLVFLSEGEALFMISLKSVHGYQNGILRCNDGRSFNINIKDVVSFCSILPSAEKSAQVFYAQFDYQATDDDELSIKENQVLYLIENIDADWSVVKNEQGASGVVPRSYIGDSLVQEMETMSIQDGSWAEVTSDEYNMPQSPVIVAEVPKEHESEKNIKMEKVSEKVKVPEHKMEPLPFLKDIGKTMETKKAKEKDINQNDVVASIDSKADVSKTSPATRKQKDSKQAIGSLDNSKTSSISIPPPPPPPPPPPLPKPQISKEAKNETQSSKVEEPKVMPKPNETSSSTKDAPQAVSAFFPIKSVEQPSKDNIKSEKPVSKTTMENDKVSIPQTPSIPTNSNVKDSSSVVMENNKHNQSKNTEPNVGSLPLYSTDKKLEGLNTVEPKTTTKPASTISMPQKPAPIKADWVSIKDAENKVESKSSIPSLSELSESKQYSAAKGMKNEEAQPISKVADNPWSSLSIKPPSSKKPTAISTKKTAPDRPLQAASSNKPKPGNTRLWNDRSGKFQVEAEYLSFADGQIQLLKLNGKKISVSLDLLSERDVEYVYRKEGLSFDGNETKKHTNTQGAWLALLLDLGIDRTRASKYAQTLVKEKIVEEQFIDLTRDFLKTRGFIEADILLFLKAAAKKRAVVMENRSEESNLTRIQSLSKSMPHVNQQEDKSLELYNPANSRSNDNLSVVSKNSGSLGASKTHPIIKFDEETFPANPEIKMATMTRTQTTETAKTRVTTRVVNSPPPQQQPSSTSHIPPSQARQPQSEYSYEQRAEYSPNRQPPTNQSMQLSSEPFRNYQRPTTTTPGHMQMEYYQHPPPPQPQIQQQQQPMMQYGQFYNQPTQFAMQSTIPQQQMVYMPAQPQPPAPTISFTLNAQPPIFANPFQQPMVGMFQPPMFMQPPQPEVTRNVVIQKYTTRGPSQNNNNASFQPPQPDNGHYYYQQ